MANDLIVSVCVVAYNEQDYIGEVLGNIKAQTYPHDKIEVVLIDSMSTDNTKKMMQEFAETALDFKAVRVLENPGRKQAAGWNVAIKEFSGDVLMRIDAHTSIPKEFVAKNVAVLESGEYVSGGPRPNLIKNSTKWGENLLLAEQSMFGSSIAPYRNSGKKSYVKSVFHGAYRREVFDKVGFFNENLGRTEDNEIHYRIRQAGYQICFTPDIISYQYARSSLKTMLKQKYGNGYWVMLTLRSCPGCLSLYHFVPFCFILGIIFTTILAILGSPLLAGIMWGAYWLLAIMMAVLSVRSKPKNPYYFTLPFLFFLLHVSYGIGSFAALFKLPFWKDEHKFNPSKGK